MTIKVYRVIGRKKPFRSHAKMLNHNMNDFYLKYEDEENSQILINNKNVLPYWVDFKKKVVIFAEISEAEQLNQAPSISDAIYTFAEKLYFVPFSVFLIMASKIPNLKTEIVLGLCTPRSGSTLLCKIISRTKSVFVMSKPMCINLIERYYSLKSTFAQDLFKGFILFFSHFSYNQGKNILYIKQFSPSDSRIIDNLFQITTKKIISWRGPFETVKSTTETVPSVQRFFFNKFAFLLKSKVISTQSVDKKTKLASIFNMKKISALQIMLVCFWVFPMSYLVKENNSLGLKPLIFHYNDLTCLPKCEVITMILQYLNLTDEFSEKMMDEFDRDSQAGTPLGRDRKHPLSLAEAKLTKIEVDTFVNQYTEDFTLPRIEKV